MDSKNSKKYHNSLIREQVSPKTPERLKSAKAVVVNTSFNRSKLSSEPRQHTIEPKPSTAKQKSHRVFLPDTRPANGKATIFVHYNGILPRGANMPSNRPISKGSSKRASVSSSQFHRPTGTTPGKYSLPRVNANIKGAMFGVSQPPNTAASTNQSQNMKLNQVSKPTPIIKNTRMLSFGKRSDIIIPPCSEDETKLQKTKEEKKSDAYSCLTDDLKPWFFFHVDPNKSMDEPRCETPAFAPTDNSNSKHPHAGEDGKYPKISAKAAPSRNNGVAGCVISKTAVIRNSPSKTKLGVVGKTNIRSIQLNNISKYQNNRVGHSFNNNLI